MRLFLNLTKVKTILIVALLSCVNKLNCKGKDKITPQMVENSNNKSLDRRKIKKEISNDKGYKKNIDKTKEIQQFFVVSLIALLLYGVGSKLLASPKAEKKKSFTDDYVENMGRELSSLAGNPEALLGSTNNINSHTNVSSKTEVDSEVLLPPTDQEPLRGTSQSGADDFNDDTNSTNQRIVDIDEDVITGSFDHNFDSEKSKKLLPFTEQEPLKVTSQSGADDFNDDTNSTNQRIVDIDEDVMTGSVDHNFDSEKSKMLFPSTDEPLRVTSQSGADDFNDDTNSTNQRIVDIYEDVTTGSFDHNFDSKKSKMLLPFTEQEPLKVTSQSGAGDFNDDTNSTNQRIVDIYEDVTTGSVDHNFDSEKSKMLLPYTEQESQKVTSQSGAIDASNNSIEVELVVGADDASKDEQLCGAENNAENNAEMFAIDASNVDANLIGLDEDPREKLLKLLNQKVNYLDVAIWIKEKGGHLFIEEKQERIETITLIRELKERIQGKLIDNMDPLVYIKNLEGGDLKVERAKLLVILLSKKLEYLRKNNEKELLRKEIMELEGHIKAKSYSNIPDNIVLKINKLKAEVISKEEEERKRIKKELLGLLKEEGEVLSKVISLRRKGLSATTPVNKITKEYQDRKIEIFAEINRLSISALEELASLNKQIKSTERELKKIRHKLFLELNERLLILCETKIVLKRKYNVIITLPEYLREQIMREVTIIDERNRLEIGLQYDDEYIKDKIDELEQILNTVQKEFLLCRAKICLELMKKTKKIIEEKIVLNIGCEVLLLEEKKMLSNHIKCYSKIVEERDIENNIDENIDEEIEAYYQEIDAYGHLRLTSDSLLQSMKRFIFGCFRVSLENQKIKKIEEIYILIDSLLSILGKIIEVKEESGYTCDLENVEKKALQIYKGILERNSLNLRNSNNIRVFSRLEKDLKEEVTKKLEYLSSLTEKEATCCQKAWSCICCKPSNKKIETDKEKNEKLKRVNELLELINKNIDILEKTIEVKKNHHFEYLSLDENEINEMNKFKSDLKIIIKNKVASQRIEYFKTKIKEYIEQFRFQKASLEKLAENRKVFSLLTKNRTIQEYRLKTLSEITRSRWATKKAKDASRKKKIVVENSLSKVKQMIVKNRFMSNKTLEIVIKHRERLLNEETTDLRSINFCRYLASCDFL